MCPERWRNIWKKMVLTREFGSSIILTAADSAVSIKYGDVLHGSANSPISGGRKVNRMKRTRKRTVRI